MSGYTVMLRINDTLVEKILFIDLPKEIAEQKVKDYKKYASKGTNVWMTGTDDAHRRKFYKESRQKFEEYYNEEV